MKSDRKYRIAILILVVALLISIVNQYRWASFHRSDNFQANRGPDEIAANIIDELGLDQDQKDMLKSRRAQMRNVLSEFDKPLFEKKQAIKEELGKSHTNRNRIDELLVEITDLNKRRMQLRMDGILEIKEMLTLDQFKEVLRKYRERTKTQ